LFKGLGQQFSIILNFTKEAQYFALILNGEKTNMANKLIAAVKKQVQIAN